MGTWSVRRKSGTITISVDRFDPSEELPPALRKEIEDVARFEELRSG
jgi:hypothetical protein